MVERIHPFLQNAARFLATQSQEEHEKRAACLFALLLVLAVAGVGYVTGLTVHDAPFTLYALPIAWSAARGGLLPGVVATLAAILVRGVAAMPALDLQARFLFGAEGLLLALTVSELRSRLHAREARVWAAAATIGKLRARDGQGRLLDAALRHLEDSSDDTAVVVLDERGSITDWRTGAERLYGHRAGDRVGTSAASLFFDPPSAGELSALLRQACESGWLRRSAVHRRRDGTRLDVDIEIKPFRNSDALGFTLTVHDVARRREWDAYRQAAVSAQAALQTSVDEARQQLAALESLTDPSLNPLGGEAMVTELLERLRVTVRADGAALVQPGRIGTGVVAAHGLQPLGGPVGGESVQLSPGRVAVVHNDPVRVRQLSKLRWSAEVASLLVVPVLHDGQVWSTIEVVSERSRQVSDWDVALARVVADRLAAVVVSDRNVTAKAC